MNYEINITDWHTCKICTKTIKELAKIYGGSGIYYIDVFKQHLKIDHDIDLNTYFVNCCGYMQPICKCGICDQKSYVVSRKSKFCWTEYVCGRYPGLLEWAEKAKTERIGDGNPMFGKKSWNKGLTKETSEILKKISDINTGKKLTDEHKQKLSDFQSKREKEPHLGYKHTDENKEKFRQNMLKMIKDGRYKQTRTKPHLRLLEILQNLDIEYEEEKTVDIWSFDIYLPKYNIYIEVDGDYFHSNPKIYPDGPKTKTQKINYCRDDKKNKYCENNGVKLIRFWECDILNNEDYIKETICKHVEL